MNDKVQLHVDVSRDLWKAMKQEALDSGDTLAGVVVKRLQRRAPPQSKGIGAYELATEHRKIEPSGEPIMGKCGQCGDNFPVTKLIRVDPRSTNIFCPDCVENIKNRQA